MQPLPEAIARIEGIKPGVHSMDPTGADMLAQHVHTLRELASLLRELSIQLSRPEFQDCCSHQIRDRIDMALGIVPRPNPLNQTGGD